MWTNFRLPINVASFPRNWDPPGTDVDWITNRFTYIIIYGHCHWDILSKTHSYCTFLLHLRTSVISQFLWHPITSFKWISCPFYCQMFTECGTIPLFWNRSDLMKQDKTRVQEFATQHLGQYVYFTFVMKNGWSVHLLWAAWFIVSVLRFLKRIISRLTLLIGSFFWLHWYMLILLKYPLCNRPNYIFLPYLEREELGENSTLWPHRIYSFLLVI